MTELHGPQLANPHKPKSLTSKTVLANTYRTHCKICRSGIYTNQPTRWSRKPLGLVHDDCVSEVQP